MAGGMSWRRGPNLAARSAATLGRDGPSGTPDRPLTRMCWVTDAPGHPGCYPGLLLEWRRGEHGWSGLVTYVMEEPGGERVRLVQRWVPAGCLTPVESRPPPRR